MSRPTAMQRAQADAKLAKSLSTYTEICMLIESLAGVRAREHSRFCSTDRSIYDRLTQVGMDLEQVRLDAETRVRQS